MRPLQPERSRLMLDIAAPSGRNRMQAF